ncbi:MAG: DUF4258 domain-containing protein [Candidatus Levybacteria bacterium]|nr:DUF4258 domain-containing protein [Candidatus Levybacteria bacterium]
MKDTHYIWTEHAIKRLKERQMSQELIVKVLSFPDRKIYKDDRTTEFEKKSDGQTITAIVKKNDQGENIIVSCWINPPFPGTKDFRLKKRYIQIRNAWGFKKVWFMLLYKIGI